LPTIRPEIVATLTITRRVGAGEDHAGHRRRACRRNEAAGRPSLAQAARKRAPHASQDPAHCVGTSRGASPGSSCDQVVDLVRTALLRP